jgi:hypothetical protein
VSVCNPFTGKIEKKKTTYTQSSETISLGIEALLIGKNRIAAGYLNMVPLFDHSFKDQEQLFLQLFQGSPQ